MAVLLLRKAGRIIARGMLKIKHRSFPADVIFCGGDKKGLTRAHSMRADNIS